MDYSLAKQLKDAGFPQEGDGTWIDEHDNNQSCHSSSFQCYIPTLEELITAIGAKNLQFSCSATGEWYAKHFLKGGSVKAKTLIEAAALLWLALHPHTSAE